MLTQDLINLMLEHGQFLLKFIYYTGFVLKKTYHMWQNIDMVVHVHHLRVDALVLMLPRGRGGQSPVCGVWSLMHAFVSSRIPVVLLFSPVTLAVSFRLPQLQTRM